MKNGYMHLSAISVFFFSPHVVFRLPSSAVSSRCSLYKFFPLAKFCCLLKVFFLHVLSTGQVQLSPQGVPFTSSFDWPSSAVSSKRSSPPRAENLKADENQRPSTSQTSNPNCLIILEHWDAQKQCLATQQLNW